MPKPFRPAPPQRRPKASHAASPAPAAPRADHGDQTDHAGQADHGERAAQAQRAQRGNRAQWAGRTTRDGQPAPHDQRGQRTERNERAARDERGQRAERDSASAPTGKPRQAPAPLAAPGTAHAPDDGKGLRLNKALADAGVCSRRRADELIFAGAVAVNGQTADSPGQRVQPDDLVTVHGKPLPRAPRTTCCLLLHKPVRVVSTASDPEGRPTVLDFVPPALRGRRLYPVGRLDFFSEGLVLLTDDGELAQRLMHPRHQLARVYHVLLREAPSPAALAAIRNGMVLAEGEHLAPVQIRRLPSSRDALFELTLSQGLNRQIRRMCRDLNLTILRLIRVGHGPLHLGNLPVGKTRELSPAEVATLRQAAGLDAGAPVCACAPNALK